MTELLHVWPTEEAEAECDHCGINRGVAHLHGLQVWECPVRLRAALAQAERTPARTPLPNRRKGYTQKVSVAGNKVFLRTGDYETGELGEIFVDMYKEGAAFGSLLSAFCIVTSIALQYGVPLEKLADLFVYSRFEPYGQIQGDAEVEACTSVLDYIFRRLAIDYLGRDDLKKCAVPDVTE